MAYQPIFLRVIIIISLILNGLPATIEVVGASIPQDGALQVGMMNREGELDGQVRSAVVANLTAMADTSIRQGYPEKNYGGLESVQISPNTSNPQHGLYQWDLSSIPGSATVSSASITFYVSDTSGNDFSLYNLRRTWVEGNLYGTTSSAASPGANWGYTNYQGGILWGLAGAKSTILDREEVDLWDATSSTFGVMGSVTIPLNASGVAAIQGWVSDPDSNFGLTVQYSGPTFTSHDYWVVASSEASNTSQHPTLNVTYETTPTLTVVPAVLSGFQAAVGQVSAEQTYSITGSNLGSNTLVITAPADFQISSTSGNGFGSSLSLTPSSGMIAETIYVRLVPSASQTYDQLTISQSCGALTASVEVSGSSVPSLIVSTQTLEAFLTGVGEYANEQAYTVSGVNLTEPVFITAPTDFFVTTTTGSGYTGSLTLNPSSGIVTSTTVYATFRRITAGESSGVIQHTSSGAIGQDVAVSGAASACKTVVLTVSEDTYLSASQQSYNYGGASILEVDTGDGGGRRTALLKWDVSSLPENVTIKPGSANILVNVTDTSTVVYSLYAMRRNWVEGTSNGGSSPTSANWYTYDGVNLWGTYGAASTNDDRYETNLWNSMTSTFESIGIKTISLNTEGEAVINGLLNGMLENFGLIIQTYADQSSNNLVISSSENSNPDYRPRMVFEYCAEVNLAPNVPSLVAPEDEASAQPIPTNLQVTVSDHNVGNEALTAHFYGRVKGLPGVDFELIGEVETPNGSTAGLEWSGLEYNTEYEWYVIVSDGSLSATSPTWSFTTSDSPTAVTLASFNQSSLTNGVQLDWLTASEVGLLGFNLYRSDELEGVKQQLNANLIPALAPGDLLGNSYQFTDGTAVSGKTYTYWIELVMLEGNQESDPLTLTVPYWLRLPWISR